MKNLKLLFTSFVFVFSISARAADCIGARAGDNCPTGVPEVPKSNSNVIPQSQAAQKENMLGTLMGIAGVATGVATIAKGQSCCHGDCNSTCYLIPLGVAAVGAGNFLQGTHSSAGAGAKNTEFQVTDPTKKITTDQWLRQQPTYPDYVKATNDLNKMGYKLNKDGSITLPNGKSVSLEQSQNPAALASALGQEVDPTTFKSGLKKLMDGAKDKAKVSMENYDGFDFGGEGSGGGSVAAYTPPVQVIGGNYKPARVPADTTGMKKKAGDSFVGVSGDNIFGMMNRRYELKSSQDTFILSNTASGVTK